MTSDPEDADQGWTNGDQHAGHDHDGGHHDGVPYLGLPLTDPLLSALHVSLVHMADRLAKLEARAYGAKAHELEPISVPPFPTRSSIPPPPYAPSYPSSYPPSRPPSGPPRDDGETARARLDGIKALVHEHCRKGGKFPSAEAELLALYEALRAALP